MALELSASRLLAPQLGISIYSFTVIVGVCLAGMALGNLLGGLLADVLPQVLPRQMVLSVCLLLAGAASLSVHFGFHYLAQGEGETAHNLVENIVELERDWEFPLANDAFIQNMLLWASIFFLPLFFLGMVSPQVIRLALRDVRQSGRVAGRVYACSCLGALVGVFATGWWLISTFGVQYVIFNCAIILLSLALLLAVLHGLAEFASHVHQPRVVAFVYAGVLLAVFGYGAWLLPNLRPPGPGLDDDTVVMETNYYTIKVVGPRGIEERPWWVNYLYLDSLLHSFANPTDPEYLGYDHEKVQVDIALWVAEKNPDPRMLIIGGGGYTFPRYVESELKEYSVEVVEIDPGVTEAAHRYMGLPKDTRIGTWNMDGRQFVTGWAERGSYSLVVQDACNDLSVPFHLLTREYNEGIRDILTDDGVYLLTVIDDFWQGELMMAAIRTLQETFPEVHLLEPLAPIDGWQTWAGPAERSVYVIYASRRPLRLDQIAAVTRVAQPDGLHTAVLSPRALRRHLEKGPQIILTDDYAPVDNLMSKLFRNK
jgi:hypothetical protein